MSRWSHVAKYHSWITDATVSCHLSADLPRPSQTSLQTQPPHHLTALSGAAFCDTTDTQNTASLVKHLCGRRLHQLIVSSQDSRDYLHSLARPHGPSRQYGAVVEPTMSPSTRRQRPMGQFRRLISPLWPTSAFETTTCQVDGKPFLRQHVASNGICVWRKYLSKSSPSIDP
jgi:hypothetical protein